MPDPERLLRTLRRAIQACHDTPLRQGRLVAISTGDVFVVGDLHGHLGNLQTVLRRADLARQPQRHLIVQELIHGPYRYADGSDKSHQLVDVLAALKCEFPHRVHYLLGNHELAEITGTIISKAEFDLNAQFRLGLRTAYGSRSAEVYATYQQLFASLPVAVRTANRVLVSHSLPSGKRLPHFDWQRVQKETEPADLRPGGAIHSLVWGRDTSPETVEAYLSRADADWLISGHIACPDGFETPNARQVILDSAGQPACACLFSATEPLTQQTLVENVQFL